MIMNEVSMSADRDEDGLMNQPTSSAFLGSRRSHPLRCTNWLTVQPQPYILLQRLCANWQVVNFLDSSLEEGGLLERRRWGLIYIVLSKWYAGAIFN